MRPRLSLKGRGLQLLAQREHSRSELRRKLLAHLRAEQKARDVAQQASRAADEVASGSVGERAELGRKRPAPAARQPIGGAVGLLRVHGVAEAEAPPEFTPTDLPSPNEFDAPAALDAEAQVEAVLDWLQSNRYLSEERFAESRAHVRAARYGNLRIRQELSQHGVELSAEANQQLKDSELQRARDVWQRKFGHAAADLAERAKQARFLAARGFSPEVIRRVLRGIESE